MNALPPHHYLPAPPNAVWPSSEPVPGQPLYSPGAPAAPERGYLDVHLETLPPAQQVTELKAVVKRLVAEYHDYWQSQQTKTSEENEPDAQG